MKRIRNEKPNNSIYYYFRPGDQPLSSHTKHVQLAIRSHIERKASKSKFSATIYLDDDEIKDYVSNDEFCFRGQRLAAEDFWEFTEEEQCRIHSLKFDHVRDDPYLFLKQFKETFKKLEQQGDELAMKMALLYYVHPDDKPEFRKLLETSIDQLYAEFYCMAKKRTGKLFKQGKIQENANYPGHNKSNWIDKAQFSKAKKAKTSGQSIGKATEHDISVRFKISSKSWLFDDHIEQFAKKTQIQLNAFNHLIMPYEIFENLDGTQKQCFGFVHNYVSLETKVILAIIHHNENHWVLGAVNWHSKIIAIFDSNRYKNHAKNFANLYSVAYLALTSLNMACKPDEFHFYLAPDNPKQQNGNDCGVFVARTIRSILEGDFKMFTILDGEYRDQIAKILENDKLEIGVTQTFDKKGKSKNLLNSSEKNLLAPKEVNIEFQGYSELIKNFFS